LLGLILLDSSSSSSSSAAAAAPAKPSGALGSVTTSQNVSASAINIRTTVCDVIQFSGCKVREEEEEEEERRKFFFEKCANLGRANECGRVHRRRGDGSDELRAHQGVCRLWHRPNVLAAPQKHSHHSARKVRQNEKEKEKRREREKEKEKEKKR
jgi:hypothetical protein